MNVMVQWKPADAMESALSVSLEPLWSETESVSLLEQLELQCPG